MEDKPVEGPKSTIFVSGINQNVRPSHIENSFGQFGLIKDIRMKGQFCFVEYEDPQSAAKAVDAKNGGEVEGLRVKVKVDLYDGPVETR